MDINQSLEYVKLSSLVMTSSNIADVVLPNSSKIVTSSGIYCSLSSLSDELSADTLKIEENTSNISFLSGNVEKFNNMLSDYEEDDAYNLLKVNELLKVLIRNFNKSYQK